jgi:hypothetical protein
MTSKLPKLLRTLETSTEAMGVHPVAVGAALRRDIAAENGRESFPRGGAD